MPASKEPSGPLAALHYRDYRLLWAGQVVSLIGTRMQSVALLWHVNELTHSPLALGAVGLAGLIPLLLFALVGGVAADALDRRRLMLGAQCVTAVVAAGLGLWSLAGLREAWPLYAVAALNAGAFSFEGPARQALLPALVPRERLASAVSLNSVSSQFASIAGPAMMGWIIVHQGVAWVYLLNAASYLAVITALLAIRPAAMERTENPPRISFGAAVEGLRFVRHHRLLVSLMLLDFLATFFSSATSLLPLFAERVLRVGPEGYGLLAAAPSVGAALGAGAMALAPPIRRQGVVVLWAVAAYGAATVLFGVSRSFVLAFVALAGTGVADMVSTVLRQTIRQLTTPDSLRGRMTSINMIFFRGGPQLGELEAGLVAGWLGVTLSIVSGGVACLLAVAGITLAAPWLVAYQPEEEQPR